mmetsp:Transcript_14553/g.21925  ORF Transcript_14553/g.21925 Transcript_14553/m.21925 type:complete len:392 (-) Transcript_14553:311-1486(-)
MGKHVAVIGAGPVGIEMALVLIRNEYNVTLIEKGDSFAANMSSWKHVSLFSPNHLNMSETGREVLKELGKVSPADDEFLLAGVFLSQYLAPLVEYMQSSNRCTVLFATEVVSVGRKGLSKAQFSANHPNRKCKPFCVFTASRAEGKELERVIECDVVVDASGTYSNPNYLGPGGVPALGERQLRQAGKISYYTHIPSNISTRPCLPVAVVGSGASAITSINSLLESGREVIWITRTPPGQDPYKRIPGDPLPQRDSLYALGNNIAKGSTLSGLPAVTYLCNVDITGVKEESASDSDPFYQLTLQNREKDGAEGIQSVCVGAIYANVGYRPDMEITRELQVHYCYASEGPMKLAASLLTSGGGGGDCLAQVAQGTVRVLFMFTISYFRLSWV